MDHTTTGQFLSNFHYFDDRRSQGLHEKKIAKWAYLNDYWQNHFWFYIRIHIFFWEMLISCTEWSWAVPFHVSPIILKMFQMRRRERDFDNDAYGCRQIAVDHRNQNFHSLLDTPVVSMPQFQNVFVFISLFHTNSFSLFNLFFVQCQSINSWQRSIATFPNQTMFLLHQNFFSFNWSTHVSVLDVEISGGSFRIFLQRRKAN